MNHLTHIDEELAKAVRLGGRPSSDFAGDMHANGNDSHIISIPSRTAVDEPHMISPKEKDAFKKAFYATLKNEAEGLLTQYLFFDPPKESPAISQDLWGSQSPVPVGARAWDQHIAESVVAHSVEGSAPSNAYGFVNGDVEVIKTALESGLLNVLPHKISYFGYGVGEKYAIENKDGLLLDAVIRSGRELTDTNVVDSNRRYVNGGTLFFHGRFDTNTGGFCSDFMNDTLPVERPEPGTTAVIGIFGGPFGNAPHNPGAHHTPKTNAARYLTKIAETHGPGTHVLMTVEMSPMENGYSPEFIQSVEEEYSKTKSFEAFLLSGFPRAIYDGIINRPYDVFDHWEMATKFDPNIGAVKLMARSKNDHILDTVENRFRIPKDYLITPTLSSKWDEGSVQSIFNVANASYFKLYGTGTRRLVHAVIGHPSSLDI